MKPPTEADLILLENKVLRDWRDTSRSLEKIRLRRTLHYRTNPGNPDRPRPRSKRLTSFHPG